MSAPRIQLRQQRAIQAIRRSLALDEASYRGLLQGFGAASSSDLSEADADAVIARLRAIEGSAEAVAGAPLSRAAGPYAGKLQAMWLALYNLGAVGDRSDTALHAFVARQTGIEHTRFLRDATDAHRAIEPLKDWLVREGVRWPAPMPSRAAYLAAMKREILRAQWRRLIALGAVRPIGDPEACDGLAEYASGKLRGGTRRLGAIEDPGLTLGDLDTVSKALGAWVRRAKRDAEARDAG